MSRSSKKKNAARQREIQKVQYMFSPRDFKQLGPQGVKDVLGRAVGANYSASDFTDSLYLFDWEDVEFPMTDDEFSRFWSAGGRNALSCTASTEEDCNARRTNIDCGQAFQCPFLLTGICAVAIGGSNLFTINGAYGDRPAAGSVIPSIPPVNDDHTAINPEGGGMVADANSASPNTLNFRQAQFGHDWPGWVFIEEYLKSTRFDLIVCNKLLVMSEMLSQMGMCLLSPSFNGTGDSYIATGPFIRCVNDTMSDKDLGVFLPVNRTSDDVCLPPPLARYMKGGVSVPGVGGGGYSSSGGAVGVAGAPFMLKQPMLLGPGMGARFNFVNTLNEDCLCPIRTISTVSSETPDENFIADVAGVTGSCGTNVFVPGGKISIGILLSGYDMTPAAVAQMISGMFVSGSPQLRSIQALAGTSEGRKMLREAVEADMSSKHPGAGQLAGFLNGIAG